MLNKIFFFSFFINIFLLISFNAFAEKYTVPVPDTSVYEYKQTKELVNFVYDAALLINKEGGKAFPKFQNPNGRWIDNDKYIFVYNMDGFLSS